MYQTVCTFNENRINNLLTANKFLGPAINMVIFGILEKKKKRKKKKKKENSYYIYLNY